MIKLILPLLLSIALFGDVTGLGYGKTLKEAKVEALADLSQAIKSEVRTLYKTESTNLTSNAHFKSQVSSNLPLLGVKFHILQEGDLQKVKALLLKQNSFALYKERLIQQDKEIHALLKAINSSHSKAFQLSSYLQLYALVKEYDRYRSVATILEPKEHFKTAISSAEISNKISKLSANIDSLEMATTILAASFKEDAIYLYPPHIDNSSAIATFGSAFANMLKGKIKSTNSLYSAEYILIGEYTLAKNSMILNMQLLDRVTKEIHSTKSIVLAKEAYKNLKVKPDGVDFNRLLRDGVALSSDLRVTLSTNKGSENLLFSNGEEIELFVKLNKMGYFYIVGYTEAKNKKLSYLLELSEGDANRRFIKFVNADEASKWISLGSFTVEPPFGIESLQVIASNKKIHSLPRVKYDEDDGYYIISKEVKKALQTTRGLRPKKAKKVETSEDVLTFTTMHR